VYWLGPRINVQPIVQQLVSLSQTFGQQTLDPEALQAWQTIGTQRFPFDLGQLGLPRATNVFAPKYINVLTPTLDLSNPPIQPPVWEINNLAVLLGIQLLALIVGLLVTSIYILSLADVVRGVKSEQWLRRWLRGFGSIIVIAAVFIGIGLLIVVPLSLVITFVLLLSPLLAQMIVLAMLALLIWLFFTASFSFDAVFVSEQGPLRALLSSLYIVQRSFWGAAALFLVSWVILEGMSLVWQPLSATTIGLVIAIAGSAYISSGLAAAHLIFYRDRLSRVARQP
jgi:hypothetical protein